MLSERLRQIVLEPLQLFAAQDAEAPGLEIQHVDQADEMDPFVLEAVPALALGALAVALAIALAVVGQHVVLAGHVEDLARSWRP